MFKLIALAILIYIIYKIVTYVKESKEFANRMKRGGNMNVIRKGYS